MLQEISCVNYQIVLKGEDNNEFKINKMCLEQDTVGKKIISYVRLFACITEKDNVLEKEYLFELAKLKDWLYSFYSIGIARKKHSVLQIDDDIIIKIEILVDKKCKLTIKNKKTGYNFALTSGGDNFRAFQQSWKRDTSFI